MNEKLKKLLEEQFFPKAMILMNDPTQFLSKLERVKTKFSKAKIKAALGESYEKLKLFWELSLHYARGDYRSIKKRSMAKIVMALLYFLIPFDFVPDFILGLGLVDDISVILWVYKSLEEEIEEFKKWKKEVQ